MRRPEEVLEFWFDPAHVPLQFNGGPDFDEKIRSLFLEVWEAGAEGLLVDWRNTIRGRLAEIIVLDQFSRNLFRNDIRTYTQDKMAIALAQELVRHPEYDTLSPQEKTFALLPFMHSESLSLHAWARPLFEALDDGGQTLYFEDLHLDVLRRFGRYPYQNEDLGRRSTPEEQAYLIEKAGNHYGGEQEPDEERS